MESLRTAFEYREKCKASEVILRERLKKNKVVWTEPQCVEISDDENERIYGTQRESNCNDIRSVSNHWLNDQVSTQTFEQNLSHAFQQKANNNYANSLQGQCQTNWVTCTSTNNLSQISSSKSSVILDNSEPPVLLTTHGQYKYNAPGTNGHKGNMPN